jgi:hypothetical protein
VFAPLERWIEKFQMAPLLVEEYQNLAETALPNRWQGLVDFSTSEPTLIPLSNDMNGDGVVSISDLWMWFEWSFWLIGDLIILGTWRFVLRWCRLMRQFGGLAKVDRVRFYAASRSVIFAVA